MSQSELPAEEDRDFSPATPLEISGEQAQRIDAVLQRFAENAELETALVVHRSGGLVSGISSEPEVTVEVISALVASASGALQALVRELGDAGNLESFHLGDGRALYFRVVLTDFILVGVSPAHIPVGLVREGARQVTGELESLLEQIPAPEIAPNPATARTYAVLTPALSPATAPVEPVSGTEETMPDAGEETLAGEEESLAVEGDAENEIAEEVAEEVEGEPTEVIETLGREDPEIVIDGIDSPFEAEEDEADEELTDPLPPPADSIFEIEEEAEPESPEVAEAPDLAMPPDPGPGASIFEVEEETAEEEELLAAPFELDLEDEEEEEPSAEGVEEESFEMAFELDEEEVEDAGETEVESADAAEEEEVRSSGPFYF